MSLSPGDILDQRYRIVNLLGQGGFGAVYRAWNLNLNGPCAVKENTETSAAAQQQFTREASMLFNLKHTNLPRVFDTFSIPGQGQYLVMDYVEGEDLEEIFHQTGGALPESQLMPWIIQICDALSYLHSQDPPIIHRDLKPANIRITSTGHAMLVDFGIAKVFDPVIKTTVGARAVTPGFSPPEQYGHGRTDAQSDIYSLGATLYILLTGVTPPESIHILTKSSMPPHTVKETNSAVSRELSDAISCAMSVNKRERFSSMSDFRAALKPVAPIAAGQFKPSSLPYQAPVVAKPVAKRSNRADYSLIAGIFGLTFLPFIGSVAAVWLGIKAKREIRASGGRLKGNGVATAGLIMGWLGVIVGLLIICTMSLEVFLLMVEGL